MVLSRLFGGDVAPWASVEAIVSSSEGQLERSPEWNEYDKQAVSCRHADVVVTRSQSRMFHAAIVRQWPERLMKRLL